jgi:hypothetical protein
VRPRPARTLALASAAASLGLLLIGCGTEDPPAEQPFEQTWSVPDDVCERLDLVAHLAGAGLPGARAEASPASDGVVSCLARKGAATVEVRFVPVTDQDAYDLAWRNAVDQIVPSSTWPGRMTTTTPGPGDWPGETYARTFTAIQPAAEEDDLDATRIRRAEALGDDNLVVSVDVVATSTRPPERAVAQMDDLGAAVASSLIDALDPG